MGKKLSVPQWLKDARASYRAMRATGDLSPSEMRELLADDIQGRHEAGDPFGRAVWIEFIDRYDRDVSSMQRDKADELADLERASGYLQADLFPAEVLAELGVPADLDLGGFGKTVPTPDARHSDVQKYIDEQQRKKETWDKTRDRNIEAAARLLAMLPADDSRTLREVISDPEDYGFTAGAL